MTNPELPDGVTVETVYAVEISYSPEAQAKRPAVRIEHLTRVARLLREGTLIEAGGYLDWKSALLIFRADADLLVLAARTARAGAELHALAVLARFAVVVLFARPLERRPPPAIAHVGRARGGAPLGIALRIVRAAAREQCREDERDQDDPMNTVTHRSGSFS